MHTSATTAGPHAPSARTAPAAAAAARTHASPELKRTLANIRVIIAIVAAIEALTLSLAAPPAMLVAALGYAAYAGGLAWLEANGSAPAHSPLTAWLDAGWILAIAWLAAAPNSLFILLLLFPALCASLGFGFVRGLQVSFFAAGGAAALAYSQHAGTLSFETLLVPLAVLGLGLPLAALARAGAQMKEQVTIADRLLEEADPRLGAGRVAKAILQALAQRFEAERALLLVWLPGCEPRLFRCDGAGEALELRAGALDALLEPCARLPREVASVHRLAQERGARRMARHYGFHVTGHRPSGLARAPMSALAELLEARSLVSVPVCRRSPHPCWLLLDSARRHYRPRDAELLFRVMEQLAPVIENASLLERLSDEAAATERARIGRDLHDTAIQPYLGIKYGIEALARKARPDNPLRPDVVALQEMVTSELHELREVVSSMRAGVARGDDTLAPALRRQARRFTELFGIEVAVECEGDIPINRKLSAAFFHLIGEALTNVRRHTRATRAQIRVGVEPQAFVLRIGNDHGGEAPPAAFVPRSIVERAEALGGAAAVELARPGLTELVVSIPRAAGR